MSGGRAQRRAVVQAPLVFTRMRYENIVDRRVCSFTYLFRTVTASGHPTSFPRGRQATGPHFSALRACCAGTTAAATPGKRGAKTWGIADVPRAGGLNLHAPATLKPGNSTRWAKR